MINQLTQYFTLTPEQQEQINLMHPFKRDDWENGTNVIKAIRDSIGTQLKSFQQGICCYCGLKYDETGQGQIEHIAPKKGRPSGYPEFSFHQLNLAIACQLCNSKTMKGEYDSIEIYNENYEQCIFKIVHPYLDNPSLHYNWSYGVLRIVISGLTEKGRESIRLFELAEEPRTMARAKERHFERLIALFNIPQNTINRIKTALNFKIQ